MVNAVRRWIISHPFARWIYPILLIFTIAVAVFSISCGGTYLWLYLAAIAFLLYAFRPRSALHIFTVERLTVLRGILTGLVIAATVAVSVLPMDMLPLWNGEVPAHRNQYELMAEAILDGRIDFAYGDEGELAKLENPYSPEERRETGVKYHWDHAYYNGHYYMYFGVVPVFLVFIPFRLLTGSALTTYHATQIFAALVIIGIFALFHLLAKLFFKKLPYSVYLMLSAAFSVMSIWYSIAEPALYCTAITSAMALEVWSLYFFVWAVWKEKRENLQILLAAIGALLGALVFGCRPPIALANVLVIPMLIAFLKQRKFSAKLFFKLVLAALPYVIVGIALMCYNYVRFDDPFEFGQAYQLTVADQTQYSVELNRDTVLRIVKDSLLNFFDVDKATEEFPYIKASSVFFNFPILFLGAFIFKPAVFKGVRKSGMLAFLITLVLSVILITAIDIMWTPYLLERYRMDIYFLMGIGCFTVVGFWYETSMRLRGLISFTVCALSLATLIGAWLLCVGRIGAYYPEKLVEIGKAFHLMN